MKRCFDYQIKSFYVWSRQYGDSFLCFLIIRVVLHGINLTKNSTFAIILLRCVSMMTFGEEMKALRKAKRITQRDLAERVGVDFTYISKMENGKLVNAPSEDTIRKIAQILDTDEESFVVSARKVPKNIQETIVTDDFVLDFLRVAPQLDRAQRKQIKSIIDKIGEPDEEN